MTINLPPPSLLFETSFRVDEDEEIIVKAMSDYWVVGKKSDQRELYVILNQKNANLIEVNGKDWFLLLLNTVTTESYAHGKVIKSISCKI